MSRTAGDVLRELMNNAGDEGIRLNAAMALLNIDESESRSSKHDYDVRVHDEEGAQLATSTSPPPVLETAFSMIVDSITRAEQIRKELDRLLGPVPRDSGKEPGMPSGHAYQLADISGRLYWELDEIYNRISKI